MDDHGLFTFKSCYRALIGDQPAHNKKEWAFLWKMDVPPKVKSFMWRAYANCLPTADLLRVRRVNCNSICSLCHSSDECNLHLFAHCPLAMQCWNYANILPSNLGIDSIGDWLVSNSKQLDRFQCNLLIMICWYICHARNDRVWNNTPATPRIIVEKAKAHLIEWTSVQVKDYFNPFP